MSFVNCRRIFATAFAIAGMTVATTCQAHFLWIKTVTVDGKPQALLFFGESPTDESYHFPDKLAKTKLWSRAADGKQAEIETTKIDTEDRVGYLGPLKMKSRPYCKPRSNMASMAPRCWCITRSTFVARPRKK